MKLSYSSLAAFLAHYEALKSLPDPSPEERALLAAMTQILELMAPDERLGLFSHDSSEPGRRRERAERKLAQLLRARGVLTG